MFRSLKVGIKTLAITIAVAGSALISQPAHAGTLRDLFDPAFYAAQNPDVVAVFGSSAEGLFAHWQQYGIAEGRSGRFDFSPLVVARAIYSERCGSYYVFGRPANWTSSGYTAWYHKIGDLRCAVDSYVQEYNYFGGNLYLGENVVGACGNGNSFNAPGYLAANSDVAQFCAQQPPQLKNVCALRHYIEYGNWEGRVCF